jgi:cephalosporin-C deacetylase-like acetyl esterase
MALTTNLQQTSPPHSVTVQGAYEPFELQVARNQIMGHSAVTVFGYNGDLDQTEESVWPNGGTVPHPTTASVLDIVSTSTDDDAAGTGARTVFIEGLDNNYNVVSETVVLDGTTVVETVNSFLYVNQLYVATTGSGGVNAGEITAKVSTTLYDLIAVGYNQRTTAHYCVPAGYTAYLTEGAITAGQASGSTSITSFLKQHGPDGILRVVAISTLNNGSVQYDFAYPIAITEKSCFGASAVGSANNNSVSAFFNFVLIKNDSQTA